MKASVSQKHVSSITLGIIGGEKNIPNNRMISNAKLQVLPALYSRKYLIKQCKHTLIQCDCLGKTLFSSQFY